MDKLEIIKPFRFSKKQNETLEKLKSMNVNVPRFVREAIAEKIKRDWKKIKEKNTKSECLF